MPSLHRLLIARVVEPSVVKSLGNRGPRLFFFLTVKIPFLPRGLDFLTKKHRLFNQRETSFSYILFPLFSSKTFASFLAALGDAGRRTPLLPWCRKPSFWVETLH